MPRMGEGRGGRGGRGGTQHGGAGQPPHRKEHEMIADLSIASFGLGNKNGDLWHVKDGSIGTIRVVAGPWDRRRRHLTAQLIMGDVVAASLALRSEEHTSELQS